MVNKNEKKSPQRFGNWGKMQLGSASEYSGLDNKYQWVMDIFFETERRFYTRVDAGDDHDLICGLFSRVIRIVMNESAMNAFNSAVSNNDRELIQMAAIINSMLYVRSVSKFSGKLKKGLGETVYSLYALYGMFNEELAKVCKSRAGYDLSFSDETFEIVPLLFVDAPTKELQNFQRRLLAESGSRDWDDVLIKIMTGINIDGAVALSLVRQSDAAIREHVEQLAVKFLRDQAQ